MTDGTNAGLKPRTSADVLPSQKYADSSQYELRCPVCGYTEHASSDLFLISRQRTEPCPNCDRMMGLSEVSA